MTDKREHLQRAQEFLGTGELSDLRHAALELRICLEAMTAEKVRAFQKYLPRSFVERTYQAPKLLKAMKQIDPNADRGYQLYVGRQATPGVPADPAAMQLVGEHVAFNIKWLDKQYHKLGSLLHAQRTLAPADESKLRADLTSIADTIQSAQAGSITGSVLADNWRYRCERCSEEFTVSRHFAEAERRATCPNPECEAEYDTIKMEDGQVGFRLRGHTFACRSCSAPITVELRHVAPGYRPVCPACKCERVSVWGFEIPQPLVPSTPSDSNAV
jgi:predicted nucleic acid-binding Zn ribbon protein